jgi:hypothetical protein
MGNSVKNWDDGEQLERSLPVVNWDFNEFLQKLRRLGFLRTLATGSEWVILSKIGMIGALRTLATGSELGFQWVSSKIGMVVVP